MSHKILVMKLAYHVCHSTYKHNYLKIINYMSLENVFAENDNWSK